MNDTKKNKKTDPAAEKAAEDVKAETAKAAEAEDAEAEEAAAEPAEEAAGEPAAGGKEDGSDDLAKELQESQDRYLRLMAEYDNFRKRSAKEKEGIYADATAAAYSGLLAGLWEFPNLPGCLEPQEALDQAAAWGLRPRGLEKQLERTHIFTHVQWEMRCYYVNCSAQAECFTWADEAALDGRYALPTAFRMFRNP